jgi:hypothetical protein
VIILSDVRYYLASSPGPIRNRCAYAGAPPCGKPQGESTNTGQTQQSINHQFASPFIIILSDTYIYSDDDILGATVRSECLEMEQAKDSREYVNHGTIGAGTSGLSNK